MLRTRISFLLLGVVLACTSASAQRAGTGNRSNVPYNAISDGLLGPLVVDVPPSATRAVADWSVSAAMRQGKPNRATVNATRQFLVKRRLLRPNAPLAFHRQVVLRQNGRLLLPELERASRTRSRLGGGELTFTFEGFAPGDVTTYSAFLDVMYSVAKDVYGAPAASINVRIVRDDTLHDDTMRFRSGVYNASTNEVRFSPNPDISLQENFFYLTHLILYAFHDDAMFSYDAWEEGFTWAATHVIFKRIYPTYDLGEFFSTFYFLPIYEMLNQPGIGNTRFWPASYDQLVGSNVGAVFPYTMFISRSGMAAAAWAKAYSESRTFFRDFNTAYYQQYNPEVAGHTPTLKSIAAQVLPTVEGLSFQDWYRRQHILDTSVTPGQHLWWYAVPEISAPNSTADGLLGMLYYFRRDNNGNEVPQAGTINVIYYDWVFVQDYSSEEGYQFPVPASGDTAGVVGFAPRIFNVGESPQKIHVRLSVNGVTRTFPWPYLARKEAYDLIGVTLDTEQGQVGAVVGTGAEKLAPLTQCAFGMQAGLTDWQKTRVRVIDGNNNSAERQVNTGPGFYVAVAQGVRPTAQSYTHTLPAGTHMISVPIVPTTADAEALGIPANRLRLAHWDPTLNTGTANYRYRIYPGTPPLAPGIGYWLFLSQPLTINMTGNQLPQDQAYLIPLRAGWNQIGHPFLQSVPISSLSVVTDPTDPEQPSIDLTAAVQQGLISGTFWEYSPTSGYVAATNLQAWRGYWVRAGADILLKVPAVASLGQNSADALFPGDPIVGDSRRRAATKSDGWRLRLQARAGTIAGGMTVGASRTATDGFDALHDAQRPPDTDNYVRLSVKQDRWGRAAGEYAMDIRADGPARQVWDIDLETNQTGKDVVLSWPNMAELPRDVRLTLTDLDGGTRRSLRSSSSLVINSGETGKRRLRLEATRSAKSTLAITSIQVTPTRGTGTMAVQYGLSEDALVDVQVVSPSGRPLRSVSRAYPSTSGNNQVMWDGRSDNGTRLSTGIYLLQITATTEEGQSVRAVRPVMLTR